MKRLILKEGERIVRYELGDTPVTLGRDPSCDLFFSDQRLSRKHCRFEATPEGVRFEDLGSRNGSYIDSKRIDVVTLTPGETIRIGGLFVSFEDDTPPPKPPPQAVPEEDATVMLPAGAVNEEDETVVLPMTPSEHTPRILVRTPPEPDASDEDKTVILPAKAKPAAPAEPVKDDPPAAPRTPALPKTRVLDARALAADVVKSGSDTMLLTHDTGPPPSVSVEPTEKADARPPMPEPSTDATSHGRLASLSWSAKLLLLVASVAFVVYFVLAFPLVRTLGSALREESLRRGRALLSLTAAANEDAVGESRTRDLSVDNILREERVKEALLLDLEGNVLAPSSRADEVLASVDGINAELPDIRTFYLGRRGSDYVMVQPLVHRSRRVGFAVLVYEAASASGSWATAVLFLGFLVLLLGVVTALLVGKRMTLQPLSNFGDDIEAVVKGDADYVPAQQGFAELSELARSVNRLIARAFTVSATQRPSALAPAPAPLPAASSSAPAAGVSRASSSSPVSPPADASAKRPITAAVSRSPDPDALKFWVDQNFIVVRADEGVAELVGAAATGIDGKHIIEAVSDQKLLEVILDTVNALEELPAAETTADLPGGAIHVSAYMEQGSTVVGLRKL